MNIYTELKRKARAKRDKSLESIHKHYRETLRQINAIQRADETGFRERKIQRGQPGTPFSQLGYAAAAERVLMDGKPLRMTELIMELKRRGFRPNKCPRVMAVTMSGTFGRHFTRFTKDDGRAASNPVLKNPGVFPAKIYSMKFKYFYAVPRGDVSGFLALKDGWTPLPTKAIVPPLEPIEADIGLTDQLLTTFIGGNAGGLLSLYTCVEVYYTDQLNNVGHTRGVFYYSPRDKRFLTDGRYSEMEIK